MDLRFRHPQLSNIENLQLPGWSNLRQGMGPSVRAYMLKGSLHHHFSLQNQVQPVRHNNRKHRSCVRGPVIHAEKLPSRIFEIIHIYTDKDWFLTRLDKNKSDFLKMSKRGNI